MIREVSVNLSNWHALGGTFSIDNPKGYDVEYFGFGKKYFSDYNLEITKKWNEKWQSIFSYINQYYDKKLVEETSGLIKTNIIGAETTCRFTTVQSLRILAEHMWADSDKKNWAAATAEFNFNSRFTFYASDLYNYGNDEEAKKHHYYNFGGAYRKNSLRIALNYGRQRGGLVCVGGVCRFVPESSGLSTQVNFTF